MSQDKSLSGGKRLWGLARLLLVTIGSATLGLWMSGALDHSDPAPSNPIPPIGMVIIDAVMAVFFLTTGSIVYAVILLTRCFTLDSSKSFMGTIGRKLWLANLVTSMLLSMGLASIASMFLTIPVMMVVHALVAVFVITFLLPLAVLQFVFIWFQLMNPIVPRLVRTRLKERGVTREQLACARIIGISDPEAKKTRRFSIIEHDLGALWITAQHLLFMGDRGDWTIRHDQLIAVDREAFAKSSDAYFGAVHVILRFKTDDGSEQRLRLHDEQAWTASGAAKELQAIAGRLEAWLAMPSADWPSARGFAVTIPQPGN